LIPAGLTDFVIIVGLMIAVVLLALGNFCTLIMMWRLRGRYERFRYEVGRSFEALQETLDNHDMRLTAAGYPPSQQYVNQRVHQFPPQDLRR
jgi:hypothetical protein